jgi:ketosteroid isomerase-like protein
MESEEVVRRIYDAWRERRSTRDYIDPDIEYVNPPDAVEPGTTTGRGTFGKILEIFPNVVYEPHEIMADGERVEVKGIMRASGDISGVTTETPMGHVWTVRGGRAVRFEWFLEPTEPDRG